ncbi:MAG: DUF1501 domain-containing protein, partial [Planctomycetota bacterium]|nr:DUF1501 domain-containing protein [Planctomycetota bacterium]
MPDPIVCGWNSERRPFEPKSVMDKLEQPEDSVSPVSRRRWLKTTAGTIGLSLADYLALKTNRGSVQAEDFQAIAGSGTAGGGKAKSVIVLFCWGGISQLDSWDPKPNASADIRGLFNPISTSVPGIQISQHLPLLAKQVHQLAIVRSVYHDCSAHGKGMYWNMTGHRPPPPGTAG